MTEGTCRHFRAPTYTSTRTLCCFWGLTAPLSVLLASTCQPWIFHGFTLVSYNAGISACEKGDQWQRALALLSEMREAKLEPSVISYSAGISACEKGEQWQRALALLSEMWEAKLEPDVIYTTIPGSARSRWAPAQLLELLGRP